MSKAKSIAPTPNPAQLPVFEHKGQLVADSRDVAAEVGRPHWQILRTINTFCKHLGDNNFVVTDYFIQAEYITEQGKKQPCYYCTEMGCDMVANKQTGERGTVFTARYDRTRGGVNTMAELAYNVKEAAEALGVSVPTMYRFINMQDFPVFRSGHIVRIPKKGLTEWLEQKAREGSA